MKYTELNSHIKNALLHAGNQNFASFYAISGEDDWLKRQAYKLLKGIIGVDFADFNAVTVSCQSGFRAVTDALDGYPLYDEYKLVTVADWPEKLQDKELAALNEYLLSPNPSSILIAVCGEESVKSIAKHKNAVVIDCGKLQGADLSNEIAKLLEEPPAVVIEKAAERELALLTQNDMMRISTELSKLKSYVSGTITLNDVKELVSPDLDFKVFELSGAVSEKASDRALKIIDAFLKDGMRPMTIISMLYTHYRKMLHAELHKNDGEEELAKLLGVKTTALYHIKRVSKNYTQVRLKNSVDYLHNMQYDILSGKRSEASALHESVLRLLAI